MNVTSIRKDMSVNLYINVFILSSVFDYVCILLTLTGSFIFHTG